MKDMINERLKDLASAQECMMDVADIMDQWESSQAILEKSTFESINIADKVLNYSKEGKKIVIKLQECYRGLPTNPDTELTQKMVTLLEDIGGLFNNVLKSASSANDISHNLEREVAFQREIGEGMKNTIDHIGKSVASAVACAEFMLTEI